MAGVVETTMNYHLDPSRGGARACSFGTVGVLRRKFDTQAIQIQDLRGRENEFDIHTHAFQLCKWKPSTTSLDSRDIEGILYAEAEELVKKITNATRVHCFSHLIRQNTVEANIEALKKLEASRGRDKVPDREGFGKTVPARHAHVDQSGQGARTLLGDNLPREAGELAKTRWGTVNLWRPIRTIRRDPLCFCDGRTVADEDLVPMRAVPPPAGAAGGGFYKSISKGSGFQTLEVRANPRHEWYYLSGMRPDEALIFKCYDSRNTSESRCCHASFRHPEMAGEAPRESMEMRFFVFYENEPLRGF
ncbi:putative GA4 desaturase family protein [Rosellinia necatrix]|uniref:Putative GA4 desaturase family protein n=1 Tax=Rosellinia necatrix TaxID=77044 RepID=A0A1W2TUE4_ROSNE|nr:putative GA4 desaturase family protein [Rosellinia necatrix]